MALADESHNLRERAYALLSRAEMFLLTGRLDEMLEPINQAMILGRDIDDRMLLTRAYLLNARRAILNAVYKEAEDYLNDALEMANKVGSSELLWQVYRWQERLLRAEGLKEQADVYSSKICELVEGMKQKVPEDLLPIFTESIQKRLALEKVNV